MRLRHLIPGLLALLAGPAGALETSLVIRPPQTTGQARMAVVNPATGTLQIYTQDARDLKRETETNFLSYLEILTSVPHPIQFKNPEKFANWSLLRSGYGNNSPSYQEFLNDWLKPKTKPTDGKPTTQDRAWKTEDEFWKTEPAFDGTVRGAMTDDVLVLAIPSHYTLLFFKYQAPKLNFAGCHNYRAELYVPTEYQSAPSRNELQAQLLAILDKADKNAGAALKAQLDKMEEGEQIALQKSDLWLTAVPGQRNRFIVLDGANKKLMVIEYQADAQAGKIFLRSVRNLEMDLLVPRWAPFNTTPKPAALVEDYNRELAKDGRKPVSRAYLIKLAETAKGPAAAGGEAGGSSPVHANLDDKGYLYVNYVERRVVLVYDVVGGKGERLEFKSARDSTVETGIALHRQRQTFALKAQELITRIKDEGTKENAPAMMTLLKLALKWEPRLHKAAEGDRAVRRHLETLPDWEPAIKAAEAEAARLDEEDKAIQAEIEAEKAAR